MVIVFLFLNIFVGNWILYLIASCIFHFFKNPDLCLYLLPLLDVVASVSPDPLLSRSFLLQFNSSFWLNSTLLLGIGVPIEFWTYFQNRRSRYKYSYGMIILKGKVLWNTFFANKNSAFGMVILEDTKCMFGLQFLFPE